MTCAERDEQEEPGDCVRRVATAKTSGQDTPGHV